MMNATTYITRPWPQSRLAEFYPPSPYPAQASTKKFSANLTNLHNSLVGPLKICKKERRSQSS